MRIWGYLLILLNIAAAGGFIYFATGVRQKRSEFQYALFKQELVNRGLPLEGPEKQPADMEEGFVAFDFHYDGTFLPRISKNKLKELIPTGGAILGLKGEPVANQTDEVKRVEKIVFEDLDKIVDPEEKRRRQMILLLNLASGAEREGVFALLRDYPVAKKRVTARREMANLGRDTTQIAALEVLAKVAEAHIGYGPNRSADDKNARVREARKALINWAVGEIPNATPDPLPPTIPPPLKDEPPEPIENKEKDALSAAVLAILPDMESETPNKDTIAAGKQRILDLLEGDDPLKSTTARTLVPFIAEIGTNMLDSQERVAEARTKLLELLHLRSATASEKLWVAAVADLMIPPPREGEESEVDQTNKLINVAATELLRSYFEDAAALPTSNDLPPEVDQARAKLAGVRPLRTPGRKRANIAHLLYHLDAHVGYSLQTRWAWYSTFINGDPKDPTADADENFLMQAPDELILKNRTDWHKRVAAVVGLEAYSPVVEAQASEMIRLLGHLQARIVEEQSHFEKEYQDIVLQTLYLANQLDIRLKEVDRHAILRDEQKTQTKIRSDEQKELEAQLVAKTGVAKTATEQLEAKVDQLFQITKQLGEAQDALIGLEVKLRDLQVGRRENRKDVK
ncbi:MAG: hypothetical protein K8T89_15505 [Planctomycetes bacterium]|nr:hypothetical protein [Planctomycetota bacterium]